MKGGTRLSFANMATPTPGKMKMAIGFASDKLSAKVSAEVKKLALDEHDDQSTTLAKLSKKKSAVNSCIFTLKIIICNQKSCIYAQKFIVFD